MIKTYKIIDETDTHITYQYNSTSTYWFYLSAVLVIAGFTSKVRLLMLISVFLFVLYLIVIYFPALEGKKMLRDARKNNTARFSGSRWSFSRPLTIQILKKTAINGK